MKRTTTYDIAIIGAGPAGLSAARTAARLGFSTVVLERLPAAGELSHPCSAVIAPIPRLALGGGNGPDAGGPTPNIYFRKIDISIPAILVQGYPVQQHWLSPSGRAFSTELAGRKEYRAAVVDKPGLLRLMAGQAWAAGAEFRFSTEVTGLVATDGRVTGVRTGSGDVAARMVISAEGISGRLSDPMGPRSMARKADRYCYVVHEDLEAPAVGLTEVGQFVTLGRRYTSAREAIGMLIAPEPGRLSAYFFLFANRPDLYNERSARFFLDEYMREDPRVRSMFAGARSVRRGTSVMALSAGPTPMASGGFLAAGDAIAPAGFLGILPAIQMGRQAALIAVDAIEAGDTSARRMEPFEQLIRQRVMPGLVAEARSLTALARAGDEEVDAFCENQETQPIRLPFSAQARSLDWEPVTRQGEGRKAEMPLTNGHLWQSPERERPGLPLVA